MVKFLQKFFKLDFFSKPVEKFNHESDESDEWYEINKEKPPHDVVLVACYTYDCGWSIDSAWWCEDKKSWMTTGSVKSHKTHLPYTHWRELPKPPKVYNSI